MSEQGNVAPFAPKGEAPSEAQRLRAALQAVHDWRGLCDLTETETYERIAAMFLRETGCLAPGKDAPAALGYFSQEDRRRAWDAWTKLKNCELNDMIRAALSAPPPPEPVVRWCHKQAGGETDFDIMHDTEDAAWRWLGWFDDADRGELEKRGCTVVRVEIREVPS